MWGGICMHLCCINSGEIGLHKVRVGGVVFVPKQLFCVNRNTKYGAGHWIMNQTNKDFRELVNLSFKKKSIFNHI